MKSATYSIALQRHALMGGPAPVNPPDKMLYLSLHSEDPSLSGNQAQSEIQGIGRVAFAWSENEWDNDGIVFFNKNKKTFSKIKPHNTKRIASYWALGYSSSGNGQILISNKLKSNQEIVEGMIIELEQGAIRTQEY